MALRRPVIAEIEPEDTAVRLFTRSRATAARGLSANSAAFITKSTYIGSASTDRLDPELQLADPSSRSSRDGIEIRDGPGPRD
jgi:hypothetical protein